MSKATSTVLFLLFGLLFSRLIPNNTLPPSQVTLAHPAQDSLYTYLEEFESTLIHGAKDYGLPGGAFVITFKDEVLVAKGFGTRDNNTSSLPIDEHTIFRLGSVSKGFASVLTGMMVDQGLLSFETPVRSILPYFNLIDAKQAERIQIKHLLSHTTGLPRHTYTNLVEDGLRLDRIIKKFEDVPLISSEGEKQAYTNAVYAVIENILQNITNVDFNTLLEEEIFDPLSMYDASSTYNALVEEENKAFPHHYSRRSKKRIPVRIKNNYFNAVSAGGINASISDVGKWLLLLTGNRPDLIKEETLDQIFEPASTIPNKRYSRYWKGVNNSFYGMGWRSLNYGEQTIIYHGGYVNGYRSEIAFDRDKQIGISILFHTNTNYALRVIPEFFNRINQIYELFESSEIDTLIP